MNSVWCGWCGDEFTPVEYREPSFDEPNFCSDPCEEKYSAAPFHF